MSNLINDLKNPESLPDRTKRVNVIQTHISIVFLTDHFVYKVKKPVDFGFLDFSTLEKRKYYCHQEVKLNRRLSSGIYMDVLPITFDGNIHTMKSGQGETVDYSVKMRRIPDEKLMKSVFEKGRLTQEHIRKIVEILADFHFNAFRSTEIDEYGGAGRFKVNTDENFEQVQNYIDITITKKDFYALKKWTDDFYNANQSIFSDRIGAGKIRDCHGDLHMEHICFTEELSIIDCIEFNDRFRYSDTLADIAFLLMDLEYHGGENHSKLLWEKYKAIAGEEDVDSLLTFYKVYRAFVRGKVNSFQVDDDTIGQNKKKEAIQRAKRYFQLAGSYTDKRSVLNERTIY